MQLSASVGYSGSLGQPAILQSDVLILIGVNTGVAPVLPLWEAYVHNASKSTDNVFALFKTVKTEQDQDAFDGLAGKAVPGALLN